MWRLPSTSKNHARTTKSMGLWMHSPDGFRLSTNVSLGLVEWVCSEWVSEWMTDKQTSLPWAVFSPFPFIFKPFLSFMAFQKRLLSYYCVCVCSTMWCAYRILNVCSQWESMFFHFGATQDDSWQRRVKTGSGFTLSHKRKTRHESKLDDDFLWSPGEIGLCLWDPDQLFVEYMCMCPYEHTANSTCMHWHSKSASDVALGHSGYPLTREKLTRRSKLVIGFFLPAVRSCPSSLDLRKRKRIHSARRASINLCLYIDWEGKTVSLVGPCIQWTSQRRGGGGGGQFWGVIKGPNACHDGLADDDSCSPNTVGG